MASRSSQALLMSDGAYLDNATSTQRVTARRSQAELRELASVPA